MLALADHADGQGVCFPYVTTLAAKARCDEKTVRRNLRALQDAREIDVWEWYDKTNGRKRNCYRIVVGDFAPLRGQVPYDIARRATIMRINVPTAVRRTVFERDGWTCQSCGGKTELVIDHVIPVDEGGGNEEENLQTLCVLCNARKTNHVPEGVESRPGEMSGRDGRDVRSEGDEMSGPTRARLNRGTVSTNRGEAKASPVDDDFPSPPPVYIVDSQNLGWNALADECGIKRNDPNRRGELSAALNGAKGTVGIRALAWREVVDREGTSLSEAVVGEYPERFENFLALMIARRAGQYRQGMPPGAMLTPTALAKWWFSLETMAETSGGLTPAQIEALDG